MSSSETQSVVLSQPHTATVFAINATRLALHRRCILAVAIVISWRRLTPICNA
jgi:hypothetical protein